MNQQTVKDILLSLESDIPDFAVVFSGKSSRKVDGLYKPEHAEILIHNQNHRTEQALLYTAIHEFAHHIQFSRAHGRVTARSHTIQFWDIFHKLLFDAESKGIYINIFKTTPAFVDLTKEVKEKFLMQNGEVIKEFGAVLIRAFDLCKEHDASFEDYVDRELGLHRSNAKTIMKTYAYNVDPSIGYENMKIVARVSDDETRKKMEKAFAQGKSVDMVKSEFSTRGQMASGDSTVEELKGLRKRVLDNMERLRVKLSEIDEKIREVTKKNEE